MRRCLSVLIIFLALSVAGTSTFAGRPDKSWKSWFGHFSGGYNLAQGDFGDFVDDSWTLSGGATYWPETWPVGLDLELAYNDDFDAESSVIDAINEILPPESADITGASVRVWSMTADFIWSPGKGSISPYLAGGLGAYYSKVELTAPGLIYYPPICGPWWCYPPGVAPGTVVTNSESSWDWGANVGIGLNWEMSMGSQIYLEVKYHWVDTDPTETTYLPIQIGYRW